MKTFCLLLLALVFMHAHAAAQIRVVSKKGTVLNVDSSKWQLNGTHIYNKNPGSVGIGTNAAADSNAALEVKASNKGLLIPRLALSGSTTAAPLTAHVAGMVVYNTATTADVTPGIYYNDGTRWQKAVNSSSADSTNDAWINDSTNSMVKLGTQSNSRTARASGAEFVVKDDGKVGIGTATPGKQLEVVGEGKVARLIARGPGDVVSNVSVGDSSLWSLSSGSNNVAVGYKALYGNTGGQFNMAVGAFALAGATGSSNVGIGFGALRNLGSANNNIGVGKDALTASVTGAQNTAIGTGALRSATGGNQNVAIGYEAGLDYNNAGSDDRNVFIGYHSGGGIVGGRKNTIIGANIGGLAANLNNTIILGDGDGNKRIYVDSSGRTGIGTATPAYKLHVSGQSHADSTISAPNYTASIQTISGGAWNMNLGANASWNLAAGTNTLTITNAKPGMYGLLKVVNAGTSTLTLPAGSKVINGGGGAIPLTAVASAVDILTFYYDGTNYWWTYGNNYN